ncbi:MAG: glycoside hydrolase family 97 protein [Bacteroidales bacterium]|nr:glycoside hydrolase family 97 protein [Bacteroidales bacterium]
MKKNTLLFLAMLVIFGQLAAQNKSDKILVLTSPDGKLVSHIAANNEGINYDLVYNGVVLMNPSQLGLNYDILSEGKALNQPSPTGLSYIYTKDGVKKNSMTVKKVSRATVDKTISSPFTRQATMRDHCNELRIQLKEGITIIFRAYNEGLAYRYCWERVPGNVTNEMVEFRFAGDWQATVPYVTNFDSTNHASQYNSSFENLYTTLPLSQLDPRRLCFLPLLVHGPNGIKICITESTLLDYPGLYLKGTGQAGILQGENAPLPKRVEQGGHNNLQLIVKEREKFIAENMHKERLFPWRIVMVAPNSAELAMNNLSYILGEPSRLTDLSWIKPGKVAWDWWNCWNIGGVDFEAGINNDTYKHYIDFASRYGIEYVILDEGWAVNKQADLFQVVPEIDLPMLVKYAAERNVGIILWAGYYAFDRDMERVCQHYSKMGVKGFKIDFMDRDDQIVTDFYHRAAAMCAKYHLVADFHGAFKPAGLNRTYPNVLNFEGVAGLEQLKWAPSSWNQVQYDVEIPFIRQTAGPMDYTQGAMHNGAKYCYFPCWSEPMSQGTRCHQLALYVVLESPLNMLCDSPTNYDREPEYTRFVAGIPTVWDETRVLQGEVGEYIVTARRKGSTWYIGGITNWTARDLKIDLSTLGIQAAAVELYTDGANAHRKGSDYKHETLNSSPSTLNIHLAAGGGFVAKIGR